MNSGNLLGKKNISETLVLVFTVFMAGKGSKEKFFAISFKPVTEISPSSNNYEIINNLIIPDYLQTSSLPEGITSCKLWIWSD